MDDRDELHEIYKEQLQGFSANLNDLWNDIKNIKMELERVKGIRESLMDDLVFLKEAPSGISELRAEIVKLKKMSREWEETKYILAKIFKSFE